MADQIDVHHTAIGQGCDRRASPLTVVHVTPYYAPAYVYGGPPRSIAGLCRAQAREGAVVHVVTTTANGVGDLPAGEINDEGVAIDYLPRSRPRTLWNARGLRRAIDTAVAGADIVHVHGLWHLPGWCAAAAARRLGTPYVISPRGMLQPAALRLSRWRKRAAFTIVERHNLDGAAFLHATSDAERDAVTAFTGDRPVIVVPNGVDAHLPAPAVDLPDLADRQVVLALGRIHPIKRLDIMAEALARMVTRGVTLVVAGPDEGDRARVAPLFARAGTDVRWVGPVDDRQKAAWFAAARALLVTSDSESFGMSVAEAMAAGLPVVATQTVPWPEIETTLAGRWVAQDPAAIATALDEILQNPALAARMGENGRTLVSRRYTWTTVAAQMLGQYRAVSAPSVASCATSF